MTQELKYYNVIIACNDGSKFNGKSCFNVLREVHSSNIHALVLIQYIRYDVTYVLVLSSD